MWAATNQILEWHLVAAEILHADSALCLPLYTDSSLCLAVFLQVVQKY
jgi:hypothetical protein